MDVKTITYLLKIGSSYDVRTPISQNFTKHFLMATSNIMFVTA